MQKIKVLSKQIYELIAAGEVISRPKFAVKELIENSIDAKSKSINVEIKNGGKTLIRIIDDGCGMSYDDCKVAFLRHATSKISNVDDLNSIDTLGFRGEALASICAVSKVEVFSKIKEDELGTHYVNYGGEEKICEKVSCNNGTCFNVEQLFYNVPARSKFLKSDVTEANLIQDIIEKLAISHPEISFSFKKNGKKIFQTLGNNNLGDSIYSIFGKEIFKTLIPVNNVFSNVEVTGFVSLPIHCKAKGCLNLSFVNSRYVKSKIIKNGVEDAFKGFAMIGKFPSFVLFFNLPSSELDINVHPAKTEIRFCSESNVLKATYLAVRKAIEKSNDVFEQQKYYNKVNTCENDLNETLNTQNLFENYEFKSKINSYKLNETSNEFEEVNDLINLKLKQDANFIDSENLKLENKIELIDDNNNLINSVKNPTLPIEIEKKSITNVKENTLIQSEDVFNLKLVGEIFKTYILAEYKNKFIIVDKHAAHERIIYEKLKKDLNNFEKQLLLTPLKVSVSSNYESELILQKLNVFNKFGFEIEQFGNHSFLIRQVPAVLNKENCLEIFNEIIENLKLHKFDLTPETIENILHSMACKAAVTANDDNSFEQLYELIKKIYFDENVRTCPHGRPVVLVFSKERLDTDFKRR